MDLPLSPTPADALNYHAPANTKRYGLYEVESFRNLSSEMRTPVDGSSPMIMDAAGDALNMSDQENVSPSKRRSHHRVISGTELSPLKILNRKRSSPDSGFDGSMAPPPLRNPRRLSPEKRFPVKVSGSGETFAAMAERKANTDADRSVEVDVEELVRNNAGLQKAIDIFEDDCKLDDDYDEHDTTTVKKQDEMLREEDTRTEEDDEAAAADDTMMSTFSTFSVIPDVAGLARTKLAGGSKPNALNDYTDSLRNLRRSPEKKPMITMSQPTSGVSSTPSRAQRATLDFDIPPMPTPRSVPTVSAREVESLKSGYLSEISSLKASLSGKEAEVRSLKAAVGDAEQRVGATMEQLREEKDAKDQLTHERDEWEKHSREVERVLTQAKEEIESSQQQQEDLEQKLEESEKRREAAEMLHQEAESKIAGMRAGKACDKPTADNKPQDASAISQQVAIAVERAARDLHALYKGKHETKIAGLKKAYEARWDKKIRLLEERVAALTEENTKLQSSAGSTNNNSNINHASEAHADELEKHRARAVKDSATIKELGANVRRLEAEMLSVQNDNADIRSQLEQERVEKGELVQLAEELMKMQSTEKERPQRVAYQPEGPLMPGKTPAKTPAKTPRRSEVRASIGSIGRASAIRAPGSALRRPRESLNAGGFTSSRQSMSGMSSRSSMMSSVEHTSSNYRGRYE